MKRTRLQYTPANSTDANFWYQSYMLAMDELDKQPYMEVELSELDQQPKSVVLTFFTEDNKSGSIRVETVVDMLMTASEPQRAILQWCSETKEREQKHES